MKCNLFLHYYYIFWAAKIMELLRCCKSDKNDIIQLLQLNIRANLAGNSIFTIILSEVIGWTNAKEEACK